MCKTSWCVLMKAALTLVEMSEWGYVDALAMMPANVWAIKSKQPMVAAFWSLDLLITLAQGLNEFLVVPEFAAFNLPSPEQVVEDQ